MTTQTTTTPLIFPTYEEAVVGENGCVAKGSFTSSADIAGGNLVEDNSSAVFDSNGFHGNNSTGSYAGVKFEVAQLSTIADLSNGFTIYCEVEKGFFDEDFVSADSLFEYLFRYRRTGLSLAVAHQLNFSPSAQPFRYDTIDLWLFVHRMAGETLSRLKKLYCKL